MYFGGFKLTRTYRKRTKDNSELTKNQLAVRKRIISEYCEKRIKDFNKIYSKYYFTSSEDFVKVMDYHPNYHSNEITKTLEGINHYRVQKEAVTSFLESLKQINQIITVLGRKYKQEILDSPELNEFFMNLLELGDYSKTQNIDRYGFAHDLFLITLKIIIEESPQPIQKYLVQSMNQFFDMVSLPIDLGYKKGKTIVRPRLEGHTRPNGTKDYTLRLTRDLEAKIKPKEKKSK